MASAGPWEKADYKVKVHCQWIPSPYLLGQLWEGSPSAAPPTAANNVIHHFREPYMYITRAMRLADGPSDDLGSAISTSFRRTSPSTSSGALSTDSGERSFRLEIPPSKLSIISSNQNASTSDFQDGLIPPVYGSDKKIERATNNNENANTIPTLPDDYAYKFTAESVNGNANATMDKELLRTCYLTADDEVVSQPDPEEHQESNGTVGLEFEKYFPPTTNCQTD